MKPQAHSDHTRMPACFGHALVTTNTNAPFVAAGFVGFRERATFRGSLSIGGRKWNFGEQFM